MFVDLNTTFFPKGTTLTSLTGTQTSTNVLDMGGPAIGGAQGRDMGIGTDGNGLFVTTTLNSITASGTATTLQIDIQGAPDNGSGAPGTFVTYASSGPLLPAELEATTGEQYVFGITLPVRPPGKPLPRYYQELLTVANGTLTAGTIFSALTIGRDDQVAYQSGFTPPPTVGAGT